MSQRTNGRGRRKMPIRTLQAARKENKKKKKNERTRDRRVRRQKKMQRKASYTRKDIKKKQKQKKQNKIYKGKESIFTPLHSNIRTKKILIKEF